MGGPRAAGPLRGAKGSFASIKGMVLKCFLEEKLPLTQKWNEARSDPRQI